MLRGSKHHVKHHDHKHFCLLSVFKQMHIAKSWHIGVNIQNTHSSCLKKAATWQDFQTLTTYTICNRHIPLLILTNESHDHGIKLPFIQNFTGKYIQAIWYQARAHHIEYLS